MSSLQALSQESPFKAASLCLLASSKRWLRIDKASSNRCCVWGALRMLSRAAKPC